MYTEDFLFCLCSGQVVLQGIHIGTNEGAVHENFPVRACDFACIMEMTYQCVVREIFDVTRHLALDIQEC